jgi:hypothetical protein
MASPISVGDVIATGKLIKDIVGALQSVGGAKSEYQELVREFQSTNLPNYTCFLYKQHTVTVAISGTARWTRWTGEVGYCDGCQARDVVAGLARQVSKVCLYSTIWIIRKRIAELRVLIGVL